MTGDEGGIFHVRHLLRPLEDVGALAGRFGGAGAADGPEVVLHTRRDAHDGLDVERALAPCITLRGEKSC